MKNDIQIKRKKTKGIYLFEFGPEKFRVSENLNVKSQTGVP